MERTYIIGKNSLTNIPVMVTAIFLLSTSCNKEDVENPVEQYNIPYSSEVATDDSSILYFAPETFSIVSGNTFLTEKALLNKDYNYFENFILKVQNGSSPQTRASVVEIIVDGEVVVTSSDFTGTYIVSEALTGLKDSSVLEVRLSGATGSFVKLLVECSLQDDVISDIDGNYYHTVQIGEDRWMSENLRTTRFNDGAPLTYLTDGALWNDMSGSGKGYYSFYNDDETSKDAYGAMYSLRAVAPVWNENKNICPDGWHVASFDDFWDMIRLLEPGVVYVDEILYAGAGLKETGDSHWQDPNAGATNESGFTALPGGIRYETSQLAGKYGSWWLGYGEGFGLQFDNTRVYHWYDSYDGGHSVRCVKDRGTTKSETVKLFKYPERSHSGNPGIK